MLTNACKQCGLTRTITGLLLFAALLTTAPALAHKLRVHGQLTPEGVVGSVYFVGGAAAGDLAVTLEDDAGKVLQQTHSDEGGRFLMTPDPAASRLVATSADGHRATWPLPGNHTPDAPTQEPSLDNGHPCAASVAALARQLAASEAALSAQILLLQDQRRLQDLAGALGYLVGLGGLAFGLRQRRTS